MKASRWVRWDRWMMALHLYTGLFLVPWMTVYAMSAFCLNHKEWFTEGLQLEQTWENVREVEFTPGPGFPQTPAGPSVRRFYEELERAYLLPRRDAAWDWSAIWLETYPPDFVAKTMGYLREAECASRGQEPYHARAVKTLEGFAPMERVSRRYTGGAKASAK